MKRFHTHQPHRHTNAPKKGLKSINSSASFRFYGSLIDLPAIIIGIWFTILSGSDTLVIEHRIVLDAIVFSIENVHDLPRMKYAANCRDKC